MFPTGQDIQKMQSAVLLDERMLPAVFMLLRQAVSDGFPDDDGTKIEAVTDCINVIENKMNGLLKVRKAVVQGLVNGSHELKEQN